MNIIKYVIGKVRHITISINMSFTEKDQNPSKNTINKYSYNNDTSTTTTVTPHPYIILDFKSQKETKYEGYNPNLRISLNKMKLYTFLKKTSKWLSFIIKNKEKIYYIDKEQNLQVRPDIDRSMFSIDMNFSNQLIKIQPTVVENSMEYIYNVNNRYAGCIIYVNNLADNFELSIEELDYLLQLLTNTDMFILPLILVNTYLILNRNTTDEIRFTTPSGEINETVFPYESAVSKNMKILNNVESNILPNI